MNAIKETIIRDLSDAEYIDNYRLHSDGTLEKREGYLLINEFPSPIRGAAADELVTYAVAGSYLYRVTENGTDTLGYLGSCTFTSDTEEVTMFIEKGAVYMIGGGSYYKYTPSTDTLVEIEGYVPLVRRKVGASTSGEKYESRNLLTPRVKISVLTSDTDGEIDLWGRVSKVTAIYVGTTKLKETDYTVTISRYALGSVTILTDYSSMSTEMTIEYELDTTYYPTYRSLYLSGTKAYVFDDELGRRLFLYGGEKTGVVYTSEFGAQHTTTGEKLDYFPETAKFTVGDGTKPVYAMQALGGRTVIMTSNTIYELTQSSATTAAGIATRRFSTKTVTIEMGIRKSSGIILYEDELYFVSENGLYKFAYNAETFEYYAILIDFADYAAPSRDEYDRLSLFLYRQNSELWCVCDDCAYVYSLRFERWFRFSGFSGAGHMLLHCGDAAFYEDCCLYAFADGSYSDAGVGFDAVYESKQYDFDNIFAPKTIYGFGAAFDRIEGAKLICTLKNDKGQEFTVEFLAENLDDPSPMVSRIHSRLGNSAYVICRFVSPADSAPANIRSIMFRYREIGGAK